ncbi:hypothetical protein [Paraburkholderia terrae]|uniref:hypothetical protein n=1 Tax=Paraburkholderia terrae TaxID=311230 RepID=UPI001E3C2DBD|nr:hypothetical protein [Paraburkholderia terrae]
MSAKVYTGFKFVTHQMRNIAVTMEAVRDGIGQLQRTRYLSAYACILVSMLDRTQVARKAGHAQGMVSAKPGGLVREAILKRQARVRATHERDPAVDVVLKCWHSQRLDRVVGHVAGAFCQEIMGLLKDAGIATGYAFWTGGARDDMVSPQEWSQRRAAWQQALTGQSGGALSSATTPNRWTCCARGPNLSPRCRRSNIVPGSWRSRPCSRAGTNPCRWRATTATMSGSAMCSFGASRRVTAYGGHLSRERAQAFAQTAQFRHPLQL